MPARAKKMAKSSAKEDWFESLEKELDERTKEILESMGEQNSKKLELNKTLISDMWKIWKKFNKINVHFAIEPSYTAFAHFVDDFPDGEWHWRSGFNLAGVNTIKLLDRTQDQGRIGDTLSINYTMVNNEPHLKVEFQYCEGEHYYKYSGWKRIFARHLLYDAPVDKVDMGKIHELFKDIVKVWYESHLMRDRNLLLEHLRNNYEKVETFSQ